MSCIVLISNMMNIKTRTPTHTKTLWGPQFKSGPEIRNFKKAALDHAVPSLSLGLVGLRIPKSCLSTWSIHLSAAFPLGLLLRGGWTAIPGSAVVLCKSCFLAAGFQAFEVQLVLRKALPDIWTVMRGQGVSSHLEGGSLGGSIISLSFGQIWPLWKASSPPPLLPFEMKDHFFGPIPRNPGYRDLVSTSPFRWQWRKWVNGIAGISRTPLAIERAVGRRRFFSLRGVSLCFSRCWWKPRR